MPGAPIPFMLTIALFVASTSLLTITRAATPPPVGELVAPAPEGFQETSPEAFETEAPFIATREQSERWDRTALESLLRQIGEAAPQAAEERVQDLEGLMELLALRLEEARVRQETGEPAFENEVGVFEEELVRTEERLREAGETLRRITEGASEEVEPVPSSEAVPQAEPEPEVEPGPQGPNGSPFRVGGGVTAPRVTAQTQPEYSQEARELRYEGTVVLEGIVRADGTPEIVRVIRRLGYGLDEAAVRALEQWRFEPGTLNGEPVDVAINIEVNFNLPDTEDGGQDE